MRRAKCSRNRLSVGYGKFVRTQCSTSIFCALIRSAFRYCHENTVWSVNGPTAAICASGRSTSTIFSRPTAVRITPSCRKSSRSPDAASAPRLFHAAGYSSATGRIRQGRSWSSARTAPAAPCGTGTISSAVRFAADAAARADSAVSRRYSPASVSVRIRLSELMISACAGA